MIPAYLPSLDLNYIVKVQCIVEISDTTSFNSTWLIGSLYSGA